jgi:hypothetical protein
MNLQQMPKFPAEFPEDRLFEKSRSSGPFRQKLLLFQYLQFSDPQNWRQPSGKNKFKTPIHLAIGVRNASLFVRGLSQKKGGRFGPQSKVAQVSA